MNDDRLTILVVPREERIPVRSFLSIVDNTLAILRDVDAAISERAGGVLDWNIAGVDLSSPLRLDMTSESEVMPHSGREVITASAEGVRQLQVGTDRPPHYFSVNTLERAKGLVSSLNGHIARVSLIAEWIPAVVPDQRLAANVDRLIPKEHDELGSLVGVLEMLTIHDTPMFAIWEVVTGDRVECRIPEGRVEEAREAFGQRVSVSGRIRYSRESRPIRIRVDELRVLRRQEDLPQMSDLAGINITNGVDAADYIRGLRDAD